MKVAITGATGVVGRSVLDLLIADGHELTALVRTSVQANSMADHGVRPIIGDLLHPESLSALVRDCRWVFNVAGINQMCAKRPELMERVNVEGVRNIMNACRTAGVERLVHTSSAVTLGEEKGTYGSEHSMHRGWFLSEYERTKFLGERVLFEESGGLDVVAVNPSSVQGPGRATGTGRLILDLLKGKLPYLIDTTLSLVDIDDCARGHLLAAKSGKPGERYVLSGATLSVKQALSLAERESGTTLSPRFVPARLASGLVSVVGPIANLFGRDIPFCSEMIRVMRFGHHYDGTRSERELGLQYRPIEETIYRTIRWFRAEGLLD